MKTKKESTCIRIIKAIIRERILLLGLIILLSFFTVGITAASPIVYKMLIDDFIPGKLISQVFIYVLLLVSIPISATLLSFVKDRVTYIFSNAISEELRRRAYDSCLHMEYSRFEKIGYQQAMRAITREVGQICDVFLRGQVLTVFNSVLQFVVAVIVLVALDWKIAVASFIIIPVLFFLISKSKNRIGNLEKELMMLLNRCDNYLTHAFLGIKTVKAFNAELHEREEFDDWLKENKVINWRIKSLHEFVRTILPNVSQQLAYGIILVLCAYLVVKEQMTIGTLIAAVSYVPILFASLNALLGTRIGYEAVRNSIRVMDGIFDSAQESGTITELVDSSYALCVKNLDFTYGRDDFHIRIEKLSLKMGEILAIVGESGSGKSALFDVLCKFYRVESGSVQIFGEEINDIQPETLRNIVRLVSQNVVLWNKTIEENIIYPAKKVDKNEEKYRECIRKAGLSSFLESLAQGDQTVLGDFGSQISGGEKQRIAFARALYSEYEIMLLDEPTAALDSIHAEIVFDTIMEEKKKGKAMIVVTHDILKAMQADQIAVMKDGCIVELGTPEKLISEGDEFQKLYRALLKEGNKGGTFIEKGNI